MSVSRIMTAIVEREKVELSIVTDRGVRTIPFCNIPDMLEEIDYAYDQLDLKACDRNVPRSMLDE